MSWKQLGDALRTNARLAAEDAAQPPRECPNDGTPLEFVPKHNAYHCPFDGRLFDRSGEPIEIVR